MFLGSDKDGKPAAVHDSIMAGSKRSQVEPLAYVRNLLMQLLRYAPPATA